MGIGHRFFIVDDSDNIIKFPLAKYERLFQEDNGNGIIVPFPQKQ